MKKYDITVAYRIYPQISKSPIIYPNDKYKLSELCLGSFKRALGSLSAKVFVLFDNCPDQYKALFKNTFASEDLEEITLDGVGNLKTFNLQINLLTEQSYSENVYFAEDDYYYLPNAIATMNDYINSNHEVDFVSAYDHPDLYNMELHNHRNKIVLHGNHHWRTANSTCLSFLTKKTILRNTRTVFGSYADGNSDTSLWLSLTKYKLGLPNLLKYYYSDRELFIHIARAWKYCWQYALWGRQMNLWVPLPSLGTHMERQFLAPSFNWIKMIQSKISRT